MPILANVTEAIGNTPLVRINRIMDAPDVTVAASPCTPYGCSSDMGMSMRRADTPNGT